MTEVTDLEAWRESVSGFMQREERASLTPRGVIERWRDAGPLIHEPTGLATIDDATGGGPVYGTRWYFTGSPDAGKTVLLDQIGDEWAGRGIVVGFLAVDEEPDDIVTRLCQRRDFSRWQAERRSTADLDSMASAVDALPFHIFDDAWTIEAAAEHVASIAGNDRAALLIDSLHTVKCDLEVQGQRELGSVQQIEARTRAIRRVAAQHHLIVLTSAEMNRGGYRSKKAVDRVDALAAAKGSGSIEYAARVLLSLRSVPGESKVIEVEVPKNKHGPVLLAEDGNGIYIEIDRGSQRLTMSDYRPSADDDDRETEREEHVSGRAIRDAAVAAAILARQPGLTARELRASMRAKGVGNERADAGVAALGVAVIRVAGARRAQHHHLHGGQLPDRVTAALASEDRMAVLMARPPASPNEDHVDE